MSCSNNRLQLELPSVLGCFVETAIRSAVLPGIPAVLHPTRLPLLSHPIPKVCKCVLRRLPSGDPPQCQHWGIISSWNLYLLRASCAISANGKRSKKEPEQGQESHLWSAVEFWTFHYALTSTAYQTKSMRIHNPWKWGVSAIQHRSQLSRPGPSPLERSKYIN